MWRGRSAVCGAAHHPPCRSHPWRSGFPALEIQERAFLEFPKNRRGQSMGISSKFLLVAFFATLTAFASPARRTIGVAGNEKLAGVLEYKGGFQADIALKTTPGEFVKYFRIAMPSFCTGADVLEAATMTSGQKDP